VPQRWHAERFNVHHFKFPFGEWLFVPQRWHAERFNVHYFLRGDRHSGLLVSEWLEWAEWKQLLPLHQDGYSFSLIVYQQWRNGHRHGEFESQL
jgi:hypothetical protein